MTSFHNTIALCLLLGAYPYPVGVTSVAAAQGDSQAQSRAVSAAKTARDAAQRRLPKRR